MIIRLINKLGEISPNVIGRVLIHVPFKYRYGKEYTVFKKIINDSEGWSELELEAYIIFHFNRIFQHAKKFDFYKNKYKSSGVLDLNVTCLEDIIKIPILTKNEIRKNFKQFNGHSLEKTGGTTGNPLKIYLDKNVWAREWAHFHHVWSQLGYKYPHAFITFREGGINDPFIKYKYDLNEYYINIYRIYSITTEEIDRFFKLLLNQNIQYFKGFASAIIDFLKEIENKATNNQKEILKKRIKGCFFGSELLTIQGLDYVRKIWGLDFISWYGLSEVCILAPSNKNELIYRPMYSYGYAEVDNDMLLGTSYHNFDMPLIRYRTEDLVTSKKYTNGIVKSFVIDRGRVGDNIRDKDNNGISITGFLHGVKREIFDLVNYIQVFQNKQGEATIFLTTKKSIEKDLSNLLNLHKYNIEFEVCIIDKPIRTKSGKVSLKVLELPKSQS